MDVSLGGCWLGGCMGGFDGTLVVFSWMCL